MIDQPQTLILCADHHDMTHIPSGSSQTEEFTNLLGTPVDVALFSDMEFVLTAHQPQLFFAGRSLDTYSRIILYTGVKAWLRVAHPLALILRHAKLNVYTNDAEHFAGVDKLTQYVHMSLSGVPFPKTYFASPDNLVKHASMHLSFPLVVKDILASKGDKNFLVHTHGELESLLPKFEHDRYVAQEYVPCPSDMRVLINRHGDWLAFSRISAPGEYLHNTSKGARAELVNVLPAGLLDQCAALLSTLELSLAGIDVIVQPDGSYTFLEVNTSPMIFTGAFVDEKKAWFKKSLPDR